MQDVQILMIKNNCSESEWDVYSAILLILPTSVYRILMTIANLLYYILFAAVTDSLKNNAG